MVIKWNCKILHNIFQSLFQLCLGSSRVFYFFQRCLVYKLEICEERMLSALTHSGIWSLFQALLMTKYAMNLENLQSCESGKLLSGLPPVFVCMSSLPLDLFCTEFLWSCRAVAQVCTFRQECRLSRIWCFAILLFFIHFHPQVWITDNVFLFTKVLLDLRTYALDKL